MASMGCYVDAWQSDLHLSRQCNSFARSLDYIFIAPGCKS